jgi:hypothetical protein
MANPRFQAMNNSIKWLILERSSSMPYSQLPGPVALLRTCVGRLMETQRVQATTEAHMEYFLILPDAVDNIPIMFIWNMDEISHSDWPDAHPETVSVPGDRAAD